MLLQVSHSSLSGLRSWKSPAVPSSSFSASQFRVFLPPKNKVEVGDTWWVIPSELNIFTGYLPNNRYHPPSPKGKEVSQRLILTLFSVRLGWDLGQSYCILIAVSYPAAGSHPLLVEHVPPSALHQITFCSSGHSRLHSCQQRLLLWHRLQVRRGSGFFSFNLLTKTLCVLYISAD